jgi:hypothetical protein
VSYGSQRAAAELAVAALTGVRNIKDDIEIRWTRTRSMSASPSRTPWTATR